MKLSMLVTADSHTTLATIAGAGSHWRCPTSAMCMMLFLNTCRSSSDLCAQRHIILQNESSSLVIYQCRLSPFTIRTYVHASVFRHGCTTRKCSVSSAPAVPREAPCAAQGNAAGTDVASCSSLRGKGYAERTKCLPQDSVRMLATQVLCCLSDRSPSLIETTTTCTDCNAFLFTHPARVYFRLSPSGFLFCTRENYIARQRDGPDEKSSALPQTASRRGGRGWWRGKEPKEEEAAPEHQQAVGQAGLVSHTKPMHIVESDPLFCDGVDDVCTPQVPEAPRVPLWRPHSDHFNVKHCVGKSLPCST